LPSRGTLNTNRAPPPGVSSSSIGISGDVIRALPVVSIEGALKLQQGFLQVPNNTDIISYSESRREVTNPIRIRGGRAGETVTLVDGVPVNNWIFGGPAISPTPEAVQQIERRPRPRQMVEQHAETGAFAGQAQRAGASGGPQAREEREVETARVVPVRSGPRVGRNDPCPCGSGKKYKKCHMLIEEGVETR